ncbi:TetR/AcrR family transcriptional regulator [Halomonas alkalisoli]|uniref:TetR/AcrR family transcriptional regulator n=1 Tax=Halomonas alkalisoli TaxID=2907158 RepID=UPI001F30CA6E|nr:TetR/AcrR family transcriptional regulator [Halomonas alkalisoli]MCE9680785.1 TetR/AcrR family transcriptional regulator [Halomonas alkalisoli]
MSMIAVHDSSTTDSSYVDQVVDEAVRQAEEKGWEAVRLTEVARALELPISLVLTRFRDLDAVANAWFQRGLRAMLSDKPDTFEDWPERIRIEHCLLAWFDAFAAHRRVTVQMLRTKAHLPHLHTWVPMAFDLSRTVQWLREAAQLEARYGTRRAQVEEVVLTSLFLATLAVWSRDSSDGQHRTRQFVQRRLKGGENCMKWVPGMKHKAASPASASL